MELLGNTQYFYSVKADKHYKIVDIRDINDIFSYVIQECEPVLYNRTLGLLDEKKKLTKIIETYELVPISRKHKNKITWKLLKKLFEYNHKIYCNQLQYTLDIRLLGKSPMEFILTDKYVFKDVIQ